MNSQEPTLGAQAPASRRVKPEWRADYVERGTTAPVSLLWSLKP